jgi:cysteine-rich repeat protein
MWGTNARQGAGDDGQTCGLAHVDTAWCAVWLVAVAVATLLAVSPVGAVQAPPQLCDLEPFGSPPRPLWSELAPPKGSGYPDYKNVTNNLRAVNSIQLLASIATRAAEKLQDLSSNVEDPEADGRCVCCVGLSGNCPGPDVHLNVTRANCTASICSGPLEDTTHYPLWLPTDLFKNPGNVARFVLEYIGFLDDIKTLLDKIQNNDTTSALVDALNTLGSGLDNFADLVAKLEGFHCRAPDDPTICTPQNEATDCPQSQECISYIDELTEGYHLGGYSTERPNLHLCIGYGGHGAFAEMANLFGAVSIGSRYTSHNLSREHRAQFRSGGFGVTAFGHSLSLAPGIEANLQMDGFKLWDAARPFGIDLSQLNIPCFPLSDVNKYDIFHLVDQSDVASIDGNGDGCLQPGEFLIHPYYPATYFAPLPPAVPRTWPRSSFPYDWEKQNTAVFGAGLNLPLHLTPIEKNIPATGIVLFPGATLFPKLTLEAGVDWTYEANGLRQRLQDAVNKNLPASLQLGPNDFERPMHSLQAPDVSGDDGTSAFAKPRVAADLVVGIALAKYLTLGISASVGTSVDVEPAAHGGLHDLNIALTQTLLNSNPPPNLPCDPIIDATESKQCSNGLYVDAEDKPLSSGSYSCDTTQVVVYHCKTPEDQNSCTPESAARDCPDTKECVAEYGCAAHGYCTRTVGAGPDGIVGTADDIIDVQHDTTFAACSGQAVCDAPATNAGAACDTDAECLGPPQCVGGPNAGQACTTDADCLRGQCQTPTAPCVQVSPAGYFTPYQCLIKTTPTITGWQGPGCHPLTVGFPSGCGCQSDSDCVAGKETCVNGACQSLSNGQPVPCSCDPSNPACTAGRTCADGGCLLACTTTADCAANQTCKSGLCVNPYGIPFAEQIAWQISHTTKPQHAVSSYALSDIDTSVLLDAGLWIGLDLKLFKKLYHFDVLDLSQYWVLAAFNKSWYQAGLEARYQNDCDPAAGNTVTNWQPGPLRVDRYNPSGASSGSLGNAGTESQLLQWCANELPSDVSDPAAPGEDDLATSVTDLANWGENIGIDAWSQAGLCVTQPGGEGLTSKPLTQWLTDLHNNPGGYSCAYTDSQRSVLFPCSDLRNQLLLRWGCLDVTANPWSQMLGAQFPATVTTFEGAPVFDLAQMLIDKTTEFNLDNLNPSIRNYQVGLLGHPGVYWYSAVTQCFDSHYAALHPGDVQIVGLSIGPCCGNGVLDREGCSAGPGGTPCESCDDGNTVGDDGCNSLCQIEGRQRPLGCGDGIVQPGLGESCDDGNTIDGDGCDSNCTPTGCGNGVVTAGEECDDGNHDPLDGCNPDCTLPKTGVLPTPSPTPTPSGPLPPTATVTRPPGSCVGDCDGNGAVTVDELITGVNIALGSLPLSTCRGFDANGDGAVTIDELIRAVNDALSGCSVAVP